MEQFATKTKAAPVARSAAFFVHGLFVAVIESANDARKNGHQYKELKGLEYHFLNGKKSFEHSCEIELVCELLR